MPRIVTGASATLAWQQLTSDGEVASPAGAVKVTVRASNGAILVDNVDAAGTGTNPRTCTLTAAQTRQVDQLSVAWTIGADTYHTDVVDVVGGHFFGNAEFRRDFPAFADVGQYPPDRIHRTRQVVEAKIESWTRQAWVPRVAVELVPCTSASVAIVNWPTVRAVRQVDFLNAADNTITASLTPVDCAAIPPNNAGLLCRRYGWSASDLIRVIYEHGSPQPPDDLKALAMRVCAEILTVNAGGGLPENAISYSQSQTGMVITLAVPGVRGAVSTIPDVNEAISRYTFSGNPVAV